MTKLSNVFKFSDLLFYAEKLGYKWNDAHDILKDLYPDYIPVVFIDMAELYPENDNYNFTEDTCKIIISFMEKHKITDMNIKNE